ncbi:GTP 3',8-cyclase MoaA [Anaerostipes sp. MSJ-23]|uniref:GTP 3',8-cyclase MoaA n=1 Tax=unclassified Anaerostipes TaxID=2635253 RepID=UPI001C0FE5BC|nr:GTP 3',8-cyclase MoaA [Anaerostipes sp. MSJ-23]MBU5460665.1 GTP 3',8-cyclase MoaA [Anaerostipes sp. MSJ-23]
MKDTYGRTIDYMRISITDRCNLRCKYCMPEEIEKISMKEILTYEEIEKICNQAVSLGITKYKITGGEPLVRKGCQQLIHKIKKIPGVEQVTMTSNGILLKQSIKKLVEAGLDGVNISLDTLNSAVYQQITGFDQLDVVLDGIRECLYYPIKVKINVVLQQGVNESEWKDLIQIAKNNPIDVRFIEMMPIGFGKGQKGISNQQLIQQMKKYDPDICEVKQKEGNGPAIYYEIPGFCGKIGMISPIHGKFCESCNRIRMTSTGLIKPCLCFEDAVSIKNAVRGGKPEEIRAILKKAIKIKPGQHCFEHSENITEHKNMIQIGG